MKAALIGSCDQVSSPCWFAKSRHVNRDITSKSKSIKSSLEDLKDILDLMFQDNEKTISKKQKELEEAICNKDINFAPQRSPRKATRTSQES